MEKTLFLVRHGQGFHQTEGFVGGWTDVSLTDHGRWQAEQTAKRLADIIEGKPLLLSSDLQRAMETASPIAKRFNVDIVEMEELREIKQGIVDGMHRTKAYEMKSPKTENIMDWRPYEGAETWRELDTRIAKFVKWIEKVQEDKIIIVSHFQTLVSLIQNWIRLEEHLKPRVYFHLKNCSLSILTEEEGQRSIVCLNDLKHLDSEHEI